MAPLIKSAEWVKHKALSVNSLHLDPENPRIPGENGKKSEREMIAGMVRIADVEDMARKIVKQGYFPVEDLIAVDEDGKKIVVEGNRRLCACKLLLKPELSPPDMRKTFERLADQMKNHPIKTVSVVVAPNRAEANVYIYSKHADVSFNKSWSRIQQSVFIAKQLDEGLSRQEVAESIGIKDSQIVNALMALELFRMAGTLELSPETKKIVSDPNQFPYTTIVERIFGAPEVRKEMGVSVDEDGKIRGKGSVDEFLKSYTSILERTQSNGDDRLDTRTLGKVEDTVSKIKPLFSGRGDSSAVWSSGDLTDHVVKPAKPDLKEPKKIKASIASKNVQLVPIGFDEKDAPEKLRALLYEMKTLKVLSHLQTSGVLLRAALDLALFHGISIRGKENDVRSCAKTPPYLTISHMLNCVLNGTVDFGLNPQERDLVRELAGKGPYSLDRLHHFVHGSHFPADPQSIIAFREKILPIIAKAIHHSE